MLDKTGYILGENPHEMQRLEQQAMLFWDPLLLDLASKARTCLEIGCGIGSNGKLLQESFSNSKYVGIDRAEQFINYAKIIYPHLNFYVMDAPNLALKNNSFEFVFIKLVLWCVGKDWQRVLQEAFRVLKPGGTIYIFEPNTQEFVTEPVLENFYLLVKLWDKLAKSRGLNPHIAPELLIELVDIGFINIQKKFFPIKANYNNAQHLSYVVRNLQRFYFSTTLDNPSTLISSSLKTKALRELRSNTLQELIDPFYVFWATKPL